MFFKNCDKCDAIMMRSNNDLSVEIQGVPVIDGVVVWECGACRRQAVCFPSANILGEMLSAIVSAATPKKQAPQSTPQKAKSAKTNNKS